MTDTRPTILYVVHQLLPPKHVAGTEIYTFHLAREVQALGCGVRLFFTESYADREPYELAEKSWEGLACFEAVHNYQHPTFRHTWRDERMEGLFRTVLDRTRPDLVHLQHLTLHSIGYVDMVKDAGLPLVYTLHEYMLMCPRGGQLLRPGLRLCPGPDPEECALCLGDPEQVTPALIAQRSREIQARLDRVDLFIAPSAFLRDRFIAAGMIPPDRIIHSDNGFHTGGYRPREPKPRTGPLRVGYIGTIADYKGVHLLVQAMAGFDPARVECRIYGDLATFPDYGRRLQEMEKPRAVRLMGRFANDQVGQVLADLDVLIIPSLWYENSPLTIHEAYLAGVVPVASDRGGMAELVADGVSGLHFRLGDAADLRAKIARLAAEPDLVAALRRGRPPVKEIGDDAREMVARYHRLLDRP